MGRRFDHDFLRFLPTFGEKIGVMLKNLCCDQIFAKTSSSLSKKRQYFCQEEFISKLDLGCHFINPMECSKIQLGAFFCTTKIFN
jgi:hypothetical protein